MKDFIPAEDYLNLKKQALALNTLLNNKENFLQHVQQQYGLLVNELSLLRITEVNALREENERLTNLLEKLENKKGEGK